MYNKGYNLHAVSTTRWDGGAVSSAYKWIDWLVGNPDLRKVDPDRGTAF